MGISHLLCFLAAVLRTNSAALVSIRASVPRTWGQAPGLQILHLRSGAGLVPGQLQQQRTVKISQTLAPSPVAKAGTEAGAPSITHKNY